MMSYSCHWVTTGRKTIILSEIVPNINTCRAVSFFHLSIGAVYLLINRSMMFALFTMSYRQYLLEDYIQSRRNSLLLRRIHARYG